jgi:hypothetical protein
MSLSLFVDLLPGNKNTILSTVIMETWKLIIGFCVYVASL